MISMRINSICITIFLYSLVVLKDGFPGVSCESHLKVDLKDNVLLKDGFPGVCCESDLKVDLKDNDFEISVPEVDRKRYQRQVSRKLFDQYDYDVAEKAAQAFLKKQDALEDTLKNRNLLAKVGSREFYHQSLFGANTEAIKLCRKGMLTLQMENELSQMKGLTIEQKRKQLTGINMTDIIDDICPQEPQCLSTKYRTADGSCNNIENRSWGKSMTPFERLVDPWYADGLGQPSVSSDGSPLPSARAVSILLAPDKNRPNGKFTLMLMLLGQFLDHDLTLTALTRTHDNQPILCCGQAFEQNPELLHPACFPIPVARNDPFYRAFNQTCLNFVRSAPAVHSNCEMGQREQLNQISAYIDGNNIYGSNEQTSRSLRSLRGGKLRVSIVNGRHLLPQDNVTNDCAIPPTEQLKCFIGGDIRVNEQSELTVMHTIWLREHNRVADILSQMNPQWNDEIIYQESRRIVVAELQNIIFNEFLPIIIGQNAMEDYDLSLTREGYSDSYSEEVNAGIISSFATAAYRLHSLVEGNIQLLNENNKVVDRLQLRTQFKNPEILYRREGIEQLIYGATGQPVQNNDNFFTSEVTNHLFQPIGQLFGFDLVAFNIQRGRDHGLPFYNRFRQLCKLRPIRRFDELAAVMKLSATEAIRNLYKSVDDIDLSIGGMSEEQIEGGIVGPTFACIIAEQFKRLKNGDRFWFENGSLRTSFSEYQLKELKKSSLARVICDNSDVKTMQPLALMQTQDWNPKVDCDSNAIPRIDLTRWRNEQIF